MPFLACGAKRHFRILLFNLAACLCCLWSVAPSFGQQPTPQTTATAQAETAKPDNDNVKDKAKAMGTRPAEPPAVLQQLN